MTWKPTSLDYDELIKCPSYLEGVIELYHWATNYDYPTPFSYFLDIIGYSEDELGTLLCQEKPSIGYVEAGLLADAMANYADRPSEVTDLIGQLINLEQEEA
jgi:hypothetical protein